MLIKQNDRLRAVSELRLEEVLFGYQVPNILLVCYPEKTAVYGTFCKEPEINLHRTSRIATKITEHPSDSATDNTNCLNT